MNNALFDFFKELIIRLVTKNPAFFDKLQLISVILGSLSAVIMYLKDELTQLPLWLIKVGDLNVLIVSLITAVIAQLPNDTSAQKEKADI